MVSPVGKFLFTVSSPFLNLDKIDPLCHFGMSDVNI